MSVDGRMNEPAWTSAPAVTDFYQVVPNEGEPITQPTEVRFLYDDTFLYIGGWMWDDGQILSRLARRDQGVGDIDIFAVHLDGYHDHRTAVRVATTPGAGWIRDEFIVGARGGGPGTGGTSDASWDPVYDVASTVTEEGWFVEFAIPFSQLRFGSAPSQTWGLQIERKIRRHGEDTMWAFLPRDEPQGVARYGHLEGFEGLRPGRGLEILPYTTARAEYKQIPRATGTSFDNPFRSGSDYFANAGADLKYRLGTNFTLDGTVNPDFGQVEADPAVINLTAFETRVNERRPFFVEGADIFRFGEGAGGGSELVNTRRIGRPPQGSLPSASKYADVPTSTTILGAARLTGRPTGGWSVGLLEAVSNRARVPWVDVNAARSETEIEPLTNYFAGRVRRDLDQGTKAFGVLATAVNRNLSAAALRNELHAAGYSAGLDGQLQWGNRSWALSGALAGSRVTGDEAAIARTQRSSARYFRRVDADHLTYDSTATSLSGYFATISGGRQRGAWTGGVTVDATSPGYEVNDFGFQNAADRINYGADFGYRMPTTGRRFRNFNVSASTDLTQNFGRETLAKNLGLSVGATHVSQYGFNARLNKRFDAFDDRLTRGGPLARAPGGWSSSLSFNTPPQKPVQPRLGFNYSRDDAGGWRKSVDVGLTMRFRGVSEVVLGANLSRSRSAAQYVTTLTDARASATFGSRYVFAPIDQTTLDTDVRVNLTFTRRLSLEVYMQPFLSSGDYGPLGELAAPRTFDFLRYGSDSGTISRGTDGRYTIDPVGDAVQTFTIADRDFNVRSLIGNAVLRWEWRPGSTLYLVWQQLRSERPTSTGFSEGTYGGFEFGRDAERLLRIKPANTFMIKVSYWLNP
ncbi:MAG: carbohydrate binding family 9 domain-containing protein [Gemmatimonadetes bacterium]|nr:carbohydrate binding family 9 domain-containing protein [Gemmatimonadota bacterium]